MLSLQLKSPGDDSPTKLVAEYVHALLLASPKTQILPQLQYVDEMETLAQPTDVPDRIRLRFYFSKTPKSQKERSGSQASTLVGTICVILPYPFARLQMEKQYLRRNTVKEAEIQEYHLRISGVLLNTCSQLHRGAMKNEIVTNVYAETGQDCPSWFKLNFMEIGDNPYGQANKKQSTWSYHVHGAGQKKLKG